MTYRKRFFLCVPLACLLLLASGTASAQSLRCDRDFIRVGDTKYEVLKACGEPVFRDEVSGDDEPEVEQWVYESEWSRFDRLVTFVAGRVVRIERLDD